MEDEDNIEVDVDMSVGPHVAHEAVTLLEGSKTETTAPSLRLEATLLKEKIEELAKELKMLASKTAKSDSKLSPSLASFNKAFGMELRTELMLSTCLGQSKR
uniref:Uncharacterized protein n=1 Tax=Setaria viridis TaxID=4556 RepID=A0A4U6U3H0_SETVI|nr:hypothetical protein SEVIR_6G051200v2 [Setaria viridis]